MRTFTQRSLSLAVALAAAASLSVLSPPGAGADAPESADVALAWQQTAVATVTFAPSKGLYLGFVSKAADRAVQQSLKFADSSETAAVAQASHDVLLAYFPAAAGPLGARLAESLGSVPAGPARERGVAIGAEAADEVLAWRADDGRNDGSVVYAAQPAPGVWTPDSRGFAQAWYGFVDRAAGKRPVAVDGPDRLGSAAYEADLAEVLAVGSGADADQAGTARFFNVDAFRLYRESLIRHLRQNPLTLAQTTDLFADLDLATGEAMRQAWRLKFTYGFWRPVQAIKAADPGITWAPVLTTPPYPDYPSGHGTLTGVFAETVRCHLGDLALQVGLDDGARRTYASLALMEQDAFMSRIWGGIHFRDAMEDAYLIGHEVARQVCG